MQTVPVSYTHLDVYKRQIQIPSGATVGIIGGTGSSKSTLVQMIPRLYDATQGSVEAVSYTHLMPLYMNNLIFRN